MIFSSLRGQEYAKRVLQSALRSGRDASTCLFFGPPGVGKKTAARLFAQALVTPSDADEAQAANIARRVQAGSHPDVVTYGPAGGSFKVDQVRGIVRECSMRAFEGERRVMILDKVEALTDSAGNALLKTLEEPPQGTSFVLVTTQPDKVLPTIASRAQPVRFSPLAENDLVDLLKDRHQEDAVVLTETARLAGGSLVRAEALLGEEGRMLRDLAEQFLEAVHADTALAQMAWAQSASAERRLAPALMDLIGVYLRDLWARRQGFGEDLYLLKKAPQHGGGLSPQRLEALMAALDRLRLAWGRRPSLNLALAFEVLVTSAPDPVPA